MRSSHLRQAKARIGEKAGKYTLERVIDVGGMAAVFAAKRWRTHVAVKVMHKTYMRMEEARVRFAREGYAANQVGHANVVRVLDHGELEDGTPFFVMDLLEGRSLEQHLSDCNKLPAAEVTWIADTVLDVLVSAHASGVIHRDIKPGNVYMTTDGEIKLLDFGLARLQDGGPSKSLTRTGTVIGTAHYMSPEQALRKPELIDPRTDLWSVGAIMFRCLTGRTVHDTHGTGQSLLAAASKSAHPITEVAPEVKPELAAVIDKALAFQKDERWSDAAAMQRAVRKADVTGEDDFDWEQLQLEPLPEPTGFDDVPVSVSIYEQPDGDSIIVEFEDEGGKSGKFELRPRSDFPDDDVPSSGFDVVMLDDD
jgi:serine/threonine protein kinase